MSARAGDDFEAEPLLAGGERDSTDNNDNCQNTTSASENQSHTHHRKSHGRHGALFRFQAQKRTTIVALLSTIMFAVTTSGMLFLIPIFRLMEDAVCHVHYKKPRSEPIEERLCKVEAVQKELALLGGAAAVINTVVGLVSTLPYGVLADR